MMKLLPGKTAVSSAESEFAWTRIKSPIEAAKRILQSTILAPKTLALTLIFSSLVACSEPEDVDWIEVPLEADTFFETRAVYREGEYEILVLNNTDLEYKLGMLGGDSISYHWTVDMQQPERLNVEFHGHTHRVNEEPGTVMFYKIHQDGEEQGTLVAPFDGIHGWYFDNQTNEDITIKLNVAGFYEEVDQNNY